MPEPPPNFDDDAWLNTPPPELSAAGGWTAPAARPVQEAAAPAVLPPQEVAAPPVTPPAIPSAAIPAASTAAPVDVPRSAPVSPGMAAYMVAAAPKESSANPDAEAEPRQATITIHPSGEKDRDVRRMRRIHGMLVACPGKDRFSFQVYENGRFFILDFPNESTGLTADLLNKLIDLVGESNVRIETIRIH